ncbi:PqqD family protein [Pseudaestuariivita rosea]|uniref:PqqD family protein n=1 Tax=Pseudaestuariivita rosea TaxID=2763263 RepID=UPI001ABB6527|nr:PqqD family protein [Pseudaestuariivita rosea]
MDIDTKTFYKISSSAMGCELQDGWAILDMNTNQYFSLNPVGRTVWQTLTDGADFDQICKAVQDDFNVDADTCRNDIKQLLDDLERQKLIEVR